MTSSTTNQPALAKWGWIILLAISALLILHGASWFFIGPETALANIAERTSLASDGFQQGSPSAFDVITLITRNSSVYEVAFGLFALLVAWQGYRHGSRWAWKLTWVLVVAFIALAVDFVLAGGLGGGSIGYISVAIVAVIGQLLASSTLSWQEQQDELGANAL